MAGELTIQATGAEGQNGLSLRPTELGPVRSRVRLRDVIETMPVARIIGVRDIKVKYKQAALGPLWVVLAPIGLLIAVTIAFSGVTNVSTGDIPYVLFALAGLAVWTYIQLTMMVGTQAIISNTTLVRRSTCPRLALVTSVLISNVPPFAVMLVCSIAASAISGHLPLQVLLLPVFMVWLVVLAWSIVLIAASVSVRFRDIVAITPLLAQAGMFVTPVGYPIDNAPSHIQTVLALNPVSGVIETFRWSLLGMAPDMKVIAISAVLTVVLVVTGWIVFGRLETRFADYV